MDKHSGKLMIWLTFLIVIVAAQKVKAITDLDEDKSETDDYIEEILREQENQEDYFDNDFVEENVSKNSSAVQLPKILTTTFNTIVNYFYSDVNQTKVGNFQLL